MLRVIGIDNDILFESSVPVAARIPFYFDASLAPGRDLFRVRNSRAPSAGSDLFDPERGGTLVLDFKFMGYLGPLRNRFKVVSILGHMGNG